MAAFIEPGIPPAPDMDAVAAHYDELQRRLAGGAPGAELSAFQEWDGLRRELDTWSSLTYVRFTQDTRDAQARAARERVDELEPVLIGFDTEMKRRFVAGEQRGGLERTLGEHVFRLWENDLSTFDPIVETDLVAEAKLNARYTQLVSGIEVDFDGQRLNLAGLQRYHTDPDRDVRHRALATRWAAFAERGPELDAIYAELVELRDSIAHKLGFDDFTSLGYARMQRTDYDRAAVERYREAVRTHVVPVAAAIAQRAAKRLGIERLQLWDEQLLGGANSPRPLGDARWIMDRTLESFADLDPRLGQFAALMDERQLTDLVTRAGKAGGGYCTKLATYGVPFVFTNFNGTSGDVKVLMHELGHAFQAYSSIKLPVLEYLFPTKEACEVHSMSLEFLTWPFMDRFFGDAAGAYREEHLAESLMFLPYGVAVDHFQHLVYERPAATPQERHLMWQWVEQRYLPWRSYGDLERPAQGAFWQSQLHIYRLPFYYIDYTLALCCALQMWASAQDDPAGTMARYVGLCARGGEAAFGNLVRSAGLVTPFEPDALPDVVARAKAFLNL